VNGGAILAIHSVSKGYIGTSLKRLLEHRWTGHQSALLALNNNWNILDSLLKDLGESETADTALRIEAAGLRALLHSPTAHLLTILYLRIFEIVEPLNRYLQGESANAGGAFTLVKIVMEDIRKLRNDENFFQDTCSKDVALNATFNEPQIKRQRKTNLRMH
jgi:hypothetical protein